ncbi:MAG: DUF11 domain-containing protein, partial [Planctomycetaceae bacterium]|nr:DUF11 domain-containing protein [Planctomycetaceae bacterium]
MRRSVWILAMCGFAGLTFLEVSAQDAANPFEVRKPAARTMFFSAGGSNNQTTESAETTAPSRFVRSTTSAEAPTADEQGTRNFSELFGSAPQAPATQSTATPPATAEAASTPSTAMTERPFGVTPAVFETKSAQAPGRKTLADILPAQDQATPVDAPANNPFASEIQQVAGEFPASDNPFAVRPVAGGSLTDPISTDASPDPFGATPSPDPFAATPSRPASSRNIDPEVEPAVGRMSESGTGIVPISATSSSAVQETSNTGPQTPSLTVEWVKKSEINVGQECQCQLIVKNAGKSTSRNVQVQAYFPANVRLAGASGQPEATADSLTWNFASISPGESHVFDVTMIPQQRGQIETRAEVRFTGAASHSFAVAEPLLKLDIEGLSEVLVGEPASHTVIVTNPGTGIATNVQIEALIPDGLEHARGKRLLMELGSLNPGERRPVRLALAASAGGKQIIQVQARADGSLVETISREVQVIAPQVLAGIDGPGLRYVGRQGTFTLKVLND